MPNIGKGVSSFDTSMGYAVRIVTSDPGLPATTQSRFILGSILGSVVPGEETAPSTRKLTDFLDDLALSHTFDFNLPSHGKRMHALWVSNGSFFGVAKSHLLGGVVQNGSSYQILGVPRVCSNPDFEYLLQTKKAKRFMFLFNMYPDGSTEYAVTQLTGLESSSRIADGTEPNFKRPVKAPAGKLGWDWAVGGAGLLIANGRYVGSLGFSSKYGAFNGEIMHYKTGVVIAGNSYPGGGGLEVLYLYVPAVNEDGEGNGTGWDDVSFYLLGKYGASFLRDINHVEDGQVKWTLAFDGASSRQLWIADGLGQDNNGRRTFHGSGPKAVPHFICLWGEAPP